MHKVAVYDLAIDPPTWDFFTFAAMARADGCTGVHIARNPLLLRTNRYTEADIERRVQSIILPLARGFGLTLEPKPEVGQTYPRHSFAIKDLPMPIAFTSDTPAVHCPDNTVTITIRDQQFQVGRNSNIAEWIKAAEVLEDQGYSVVFVPDFDKTDAEFGPFLSCRQAAEDLHYRYALYKKAVVNFFVPNGPWIFGMFGDISAILMKPLCREYRNSNERHWRKFGVHPGEQMPWAQPNQRLHWTDDTAEDILMAFSVWQDVTSMAHV